MTLNFWRKTSLIMLFPLIFWGCEFDNISQDSSSGEAGTGGSMARFTIKGDYLYSVDFNELHVFNIQSSDSLSRVKKIHVGFGIETIFPFGELLFLGARDGMYIFDISEPESPIQVSFTPHFMSYDPVVVQDSFAYVTLRSENGLGASNVLQIYSISDIKNPELIKEYEMKGPRGLGIDGNTLFVCDDGLKVFEVSEGIELNRIAHFQIPAIDVIPKGNTLYVVAESGFYQYTYSEGEIVFISKIEINNH